MKWYTVSEYVDIETGEILKKAEVERNYYKTGKKSVKTEFNENYNIRKYIIECRKHGQSKLEL